MSVIDALRRAFSRIGAAHLLLASIVSFALAAGKTTGGEADAASETIESETIESAAIETVDAPVLGSASLAPPPLRNVRAEVEPTPRSVLAPEPFHAPPSRPLVERTMVVHDPALVDPVLRSSVADWPMRPLPVAPGAVGHDYFQPAVPLTALEDGVAAPASVEPTYLPPGRVYHGFEEFCDADAIGPFWSGTLDYQVLPGSLLWRPPLANQREPHMWAKFSDANDESTIDTAIGHQFGLVAWRPPHRPTEGIQLDAFAAVFTRFNDGRLLTAADYRVGAPLTYRKGRWSAKVGYEHTSTHLGDEFIEATGRRQVAHVRDEIVFGLARRFGRDGSLRAYGQAGYSFMTSEAIEGDDDRYDLGLEWWRACETGMWGRPFAAIDLDLRSDQDYEPNLTVQAGVQFLSGPAFRSARIGVEYYTGRSPYGQFFQEEEDWIAFFGSYDW